MGWVEGRPICIRVHASDRIGRSRFVVGRKCADRPSRSPSRGAHTFCTTSHRTGERISETEFSIPTGQLGDPTMSHRLLVPATVRAGEAPLRSFTLARTGT